MTNPSIPFFEYPRAYLDHREELLRVIDDVGRRGAFIMQQELRDFETALATYTGAAHAIGVANATDGLEICWQAIGLRPGDEVILCSHTMVATASAVVAAGGCPVPVEVGSDHLIDPDAVDAAITPRTVGIMPTHLNGRTCDMDRLMAIAQRHGLFVVEDAAQALGSRFKGRHAGTFGNAAAISFYPAKVLGCLGDGGAVITNGSALYTQMWCLHDHGRDHTTGDVLCWGRNSRLDNLQAAILHHRLGSYDKVIARRRAIASVYQARLGDMAELQLPPSPVTGDHFDIYQNYELQADDREGLRGFLKERGVGTLVQWGGQAIHQFHRLGFSARLPRTDRFFERCLMLPLNMFVSDEDVHYVCDQVRMFYGGSK
jgi:dTDP-4-amino-4,6-dideoxygalactose transaminase